ncbi:MAG: hypothetical protein H0V88_07630 [Pyrinomonadaceae bacterium]|nr:hypothetical protein [Pyrinomonadaceae bacterium]
MQIISRVSKTKPGDADRRAGERGAALITMLLVSVLLLAAGGALIMTTAMSATNAIDATAESQAYYAAEAGMQATLAVLRGNVAPNPLFDTSSASADANKISFRKAVNTPNLSRWLTYSTSTTYSSRVLLNGNASTYSPISGSAYSVTVSDPDNTSTVAFSVSGIFPTSTSSPQTSIIVGTTNSTMVTITYTAPAATTLTSSGDRPFGSFQLAVHNQFTATSTSLDIPFKLTISQTAPYPATTASPQTLVIDCRLVGVFSATNSTLNIVFPTLANNFNGVTYSRTFTQLPIALSGTTTITPITVTAPEPSRLKVQVIGYGPRGARKYMQMLISRFGLDYTARAAITLRGSDGTCSPMTFDVGNSSSYTYTGNDNAGGANLPAFAVTNTCDYTTAAPTTTNASQVTGNPPLDQASLSSLSSFLQSADSARAAVAALRELAKNQRYPDSCTGTVEACDRYFPAGTTPDTFGANTGDPSNGLITFVDGNAALPPGGGAGLLVVTGTLDMRGNADFKGLILVLGTGELLRDGGGNGTTLGSIVVAKFGATGDFLASSFNSNGGGTADVKYDSKWVERALSTTAPRVMGVSESEN